jgi:hypothetical protein
MQLCLKLMRFPSVKNTRSAKRLCEKMLRRKSILLNRISEGANQKKLKRFSQDLWTEKLRHSIKCRLYSSKRKNKFLKRFYQTIS